MLKRQLIAIAMQIHNPIAGWLHSTITEQTSTAGSVAKIGGSQR